MRISDADLKGLAVVSEMGDPIGRVSGFLIDVDSHQVIQYVVARLRGLSAIIPEELLVHNSQVVSIDERQMVVRGSAKEFEAFSPAFRQQVRDAAGAVSQMSRERA